MKPAAAAFAAVSALLVCSAPAVADTEDQQFFSRLNALGFVVTDPALLRSQGHMICNEGLRHGVSWGEMHGQLLQWGYSHSEASILGIAAINSYCPQYSSVAAQIWSNY